MPKPDRPRILVIDDDTLFLEITSYHLGRSGFAVEVASDPRLGLDRAIEQQFDLVLLDLMMPELNGEELLALLKPLNISHKVIVVTAHASDQYRARVRDLGAADYVEKPVDPTELLRVVNSALGGSQAGTPPDAPPSGRLSRLAYRCSGWVYDQPVTDKPRQVVAAALLAGLLFAAIWLVIG